MIAGILITLILAIGGLTGGVVLASDQAAPGDLLYTIDRSLEDLRMGFASREARARLSYEYSQERMLEIIKLFERGDEEDLYFAWQDFSQDLVSLGQVVDVTADEPYAALDLILEEVQKDDAHLANTGNYCSNLETEQHPVGYELAFQYEVDYAEIMGWFCQGYGFGEIKLAYDLSQLSGLTPLEIFDMRLLGMGWGQIKKAVDVSPEASDDSNDETSEGNESEGEQSPREEVNCTGANPHPHGEDLAYQFRVSNDEIMGWFCQGYGFGEIKLAYEIHEEIGESVDNIFALRATGMGWGKIKQHYGLIGNPHDGIDKPGNADEAGNSDKDKDDNKDKNGRPEDTPGNRNKNKGNNGNK